MAQDTRTFENGEAVDLYVGGAWVPAVVKGVNAAFTASAGTGYTYTVTPDLAGQPQFTNRPPIHYPTFKQVTTASLRPRGDEGADPEEPVDMLVNENKGGNVSVGDFSHADNLSRLNKATADSLGYDSTDRNPSGEMPVSVPAGTSANIKSDDAGNVTHGANASVEVVGDVTGTNGTGAVNAAGQVPAAAPNTPVNQTPYTVEASTDPALNLDTVNIPNTGVAPAVNENARTDSEPGKTGNDAPVNSNAADDMLVAGDQQDGATASSVPAGSKDDHQANADAKNDKLSDEQKASAVENLSVPELKDDLESGKLKTKGTNTGFNVDAANERAKNAEKATDPDNKDGKMTQEQADKVAEVQSKTGNDNPQNQGVAAENAPQAPKTTEQAKQQQSTGQAATGNNSQSGSSNTPQNPSSNPANK